MLTKNHSTFTYEIRKNVNSWMIPKIDRDLDEILGTGFHETALIVMGQEFYAKETNLK